MTRIIRAKPVALAVLLIVTLPGVPAFAQMDFAGEWAPIRHEDIEPRDPLPGEYVGLPINDLGRMRADTWSASSWTQPEWQCRPYGGAYMSRGSIMRLRIRKEVDPTTRETVAFHTEWTNSVESAIYLDGRPHPSSRFAAHTWAGFSTAEWVGDVLKITTTHLKEASLRRNGVPSSDKATLTQYWSRHGDVLTWVVIVYDPVYLTEPLIRSTEYRWDPYQQIPPYPCTVVTEVERPRGVVPHNLPGANPGLTDYSTKFEIPYEATTGGAHTMYPEYREKLRQLEGNQLPAKRYNP